MKFKQATQITPNTVTENGMPAFTTTHSATLDLFSKGGAMRGKNAHALIRDAFIEDPSVTLQVLQWLRDVRNGAGERQIYRDAIKVIATSSTKAELFLLEQAPLIGRWDDVFDNFKGLSQEAQIFVLEGIKNTLMDAENSSRNLLAKWLPRKGDFANILRSYLKLSPKQYRKLLVGLTNVVETKMCANRWSEIDYSKVPSRASALYQKAFAKHDPIGYKKYRDALMKGTTKINAGAVYPYEIIQAAKNSGQWEVCEAQWKAIPLEFESNILVMSDTSGSMSAPAGGYGSKSTVSCYDVSVSLGMFLAERNKGAFKDLTITFSTNPKVRNLKGSLQSRYKEIVRDSEMGNTNLAKAMDLILKIAMDNKVAQEDMPDTLLILSDMQFDSCAEGVSSLPMIQIKFEKAGYKMPAIVFWNLNAKYENTQATKHDKGVALVSGFSPQIVKNLVGIATKTPVEVMLGTVSKYPTISF